MPALSASLTYKKYALLGPWAFGSRVGGEGRVALSNWHLACSLSSKENELTRNLSAILVVATIVVVILVALVRAGGSQTQEK